MTKVYLAGLISTEHPQSIQWRDELVKLWEHHSRIIPITPMNSKMDLAAHTKDGGLNDPRRTPSDIILRDFRDVIRSDVVLANLNVFGSKRPMLGTWPELGWAWEHHKPIMAVSTPGDANYGLARNHPFVMAMVAHYFDHVEEAAEFIEDYYYS